MSFLSNLITMDIEFSSLAILVSFFTFVVIILKLKTPQSKSNFPPGPRKLPFIGNLHLLANFQPPHRTLANLSSKYGPIMHHKTDIAFAPYGEYWRQLRKICTLELLSTKRVQSFRSIREEEISNLCKWIASKAGSIINFTERVESSVFDIVMRACFGKKTEEHVAFMSVIHKTTEMMGVFYIGDVYPSIKLFRKLSGMRDRLEKLHKISDMIIENIINDHKVVNGVELNKREDLVDVLLKFNDAGAELYLTMDNIKAVLMDIFGAGVETSSTTINWAMTELLKYPRIMNKAQKEVRQVFNEQGYVDESYLDELKYLKSVIKETLRMHPPVPLLVPRESKEACEIQGYKIPAKTRVLVNAWAIARDPFGAGRRICPGMSFGIANVELPLAMLLYHFDWILPNGMKPEELDMAETLGITARKKNPLYLIPILMISHCCVLTSFSSCRLENLSGQASMTSDSPAKTRVLVNAWAIARDPFGSGRRICPGMSFAIANVELPLAMLLYHFDWILPNGMKPEELDMEESFGVTTRRKNPLYVIPILKNPMPVI